MYTILTIAVIALLCASIADAQLLPGSEAWTMEGDLAAGMVAGIDRFLMRELAASTQHRNRYWSRKFSSHEDYVRSVASNRDRLRRMIGVVDQREAAEMNILGTVAACRSHRIASVRWNVLKGVSGEGLLLEPVRAPIADVIALPDCDESPEAIAGLVAGVPSEAQFARRLAQAGCRVLVPSLIDRRDRYSGNPSIRMTNQPHREFIYRAAYELGRHIIGYEVQKVLAAVDWLLDSRQEGGGASRVPLGIVGYGEGGLIAFYSAAADPRIDAAAVCGYFQPREQLWQEPIYRNVFGLLDEFGDAEIASLIAPRVLLVDACRHPTVTGPPAPSSERSGAAPGDLSTPPVESVRREFDRAKEIVEPLRPPLDWTLVVHEDSSALPAGDRLTTSFLRAMKVKRRRQLSRDSLYGNESPDNLQREIEEREKRQFEQLVEHTQFLMRESEFRRAELWSGTIGGQNSTAASSANWNERCAVLREYLWNDVIGPLPPPSIPMHPRSRKVYDTPHFTGYEVVLDVYPDVFAFGILLVPKAIGPDERRPVVVCQHGLEGRPRDVADPSIDNPSYHRYACRLAELGFVTYAPQNPYIGGDRFRVLQRKANPLKKSLFSFIVRQHERTLEWLKTLPFVDEQRIAFYGLSYGGKTAMRVPALLDGYCLSICSADYNEWIWKNVSARHRYSYMFTGEYEMPEFNLANTFNYAELSWLICPRPFMVERGHHDGVAPDEWVAYEYARTRREYVALGIADRTEIEFFDGPHTIHGVGTFQFLKKHLHWQK